MALREEGNWDGSHAAGEDDRLPTMTTCRRGHLRRGTGGRAELLPPRAKSPRLIAGPSWLSDHDEALRCMSIFAET